MTKRLGGLILSALLAASCAAPQPSSLPTTGTLKLALTGLFPVERQLQALQAGARAKVSISGPDIAQALILTAPINGSSLVATLTGIPAGPNRVIEIESQDENGDPIPGGRFRTTATLVEGPNTAMISVATTPRGDVYSRLLSENPNLARSLDADRLQARIEAIYRAQHLGHFGLIDGVAIADALSTNGGLIEALATSDSAFVQHGHGLRVEVKGLPQSLSAEIWVDDPVSPKQTGISNGGLEISPIKPGTWRLYGRAGSLRVGPVEIDPASPEVRTLDFSTGVATAPSLPHGRGGAASATLPFDGQEHLIVAGGVISEGAGDGPDLLGNWDNHLTVATDSVLAFDGTTWKTLPGKMDTAVSHAAFASKGHKLWVLGGITQAGARTDLIQVFDSESGAWSTLPNPLPFPSNLGSAGFLGEDLYLTAGMEFSGSIVGTNWSVYRIDPETGNHTTAMPFLAYRRYGAATAVAEGKLFVISGIDYADDLIHAVEVFDPASPTVLAVAPIPTPRFGAIAWPADGKIVVAGGVGRSGMPMDTVETYDLARNRWETHAPLRTPRGYLAGGVLGDSFFAAGGHDGLYSPPYSYVAPLSAVEALAR